MIESVLNGDWSAAMANLPRYGLLVVVAPVLSLLAVKILLMAKAASADKRQTEWVFTCERDTEGFPILAKAVARNPRSRAQ